MEEYLALIAKSPLFQGIAEKEVPALLKQLQVRQKTYKKGEFLFYAGDPMSYVGLVLDGTVHIIQEDYWGNRNILSPVPAGISFGEAFACQPHSQATVSVVAATDATIMQVYIERVLHTSQTLSGGQVRFVANILALMSQKNRLLTEKIRYLTQRSTRRKIMIYLSDIARMKGTSSFSLPFNRQQLADFLSVDRSALSAELSKMKKDGLIDYKKDQFTLFHEGV